MTDPEDPNPTGRHLALFLKDAVVFLFISTVTLPAYFLGRKYFDEPVDIWLTVFVSVYLSAVVFMTYRGFGAARRLVILEASILGAIIIGVYDKLAISTDFRWGAWVLTTMQGAVILFVLLLLPGLAITFMRRND